MINNKIIYYFLNNITFLLYIWHFKMADNEFQRARVLFDKGISEFDKKDYKEVKNKRISH